MRPSRAARGHSPAAEVGLGWSICHRDLGSLDKGGMSSVYTLLNMTDLRGVWAAGIVREWRRRGERR